MPLPQNALGGDVGKISSLVTQRLNTACRDKPMAATAKSTCSSGTLNDLEQEKENFRKQDKVAFVVGYTGSIGSKLLQALIEEKLLF